MHETPQTGSAIKWWSSHGEAAWVSLMPSFLRKDSSAPSATRKSAAEMLGRPDLSTSATEFFETWQKKGAKEAAAALDRRADAAWTELLDNLSKDHGYEIKEVVSATARNEGDYVVRATGARVHVQMVKMDLVVKEDGEFHPDDSWVIAVAVDTKKVYALTVGPAPTQ